jgi:hypothetical protein
VKIAKNIPKEVWEELNKQMAEENPEDESE